MWDGQVKVITGIRRCGKSYLLNPLFKDYLVEGGTPEDHILSFQLDLAKDIRFRDPLVLAASVREQVEGQPEKFYDFWHAVMQHSGISSAKERRNKILFFISDLACYT